jgi:UDP-perosamine 4-acetyltransferase
MSKKKLLIFPYNGNGIEALDCILEEEYDFIGFIDDSLDKLIGKHPHDVFNRDILNQQPETFVLAVPGSPSSYLKREQFIQSLGINKERFITLIHPTASIGKGVKIGFNTLIMAGVVLTSNAIVGNHVCILPNTVIHHDCLINDYSLIGSNVVVAGGTVLGKNCYIGSGSNVFNGIEIGNNSLVGMGSNVIKSISNNLIVAGNPAKNIAKKI